MNDIMCMRTNWKTAKGSHTNKHPVIPPYILDSIDDAFGQSSMFCDCVVGDAYIDYPLLKIIN